MKHRPITIQPIPVKDLNPGDIIYYSPRFETTTATSMCLHDGKFTRVIGVQE